MFRRREREFEVWTDAQGRTHRTPRGRRKVAELRATAAHRADMEDRTGPRLRWGWDEKGTAKWWYMVKGPKRWVRRGKRPEWHHGYYYVPHKAWPVVPPRSDWPDSRAYSAPPGTTLSSVVPDDIWRAAHMTPEDRSGRRDTSDISARAEAFQGRRERSYGSARWFSR